MDRSQFTYLSGLDSVRFPNNQNQPCGLNPAKDSMKHYVEAYRMLKAVLNGPAVGVLTMNEIVDSQLFELPPARFFGEKKLSGEDRAETEKTIREDPFELLCEGVRANRILVSTYRVSADPAASPVSIRGYAVSSFRKAKIKNEPSPKETEFFIPSHNSFLSYNVGAAGTERPADVKIDTERKNAYLDVLIGFFAGDAAAVRSYLKKPPQTVREALRASSPDMLRVAEELRAAPDCVAFPISKMYRLNRSTQDILTYIHRLLELDALCASCGAYLVQQPGPTYASVFRDFREDALLELLCDRFGVKKGRPGSDRLRCCLRFSAALKAHITGIPNANRSDAYRFIQDKTNAYGIVHEEYNRKSPLTDEGWANLLDVHNSANILSHLNSNFLPKMNNVAAAYANNLYDYAYALKSGCTYIAGGMNGDTLARTPLAECENCEEGSHDEWII